MFIGALRYNVDMTYKESALIKVLVPWALLVLLLLLSNPAKLPSTILVVPFVLLFLAIYFTITEGARLLRDSQQGEAADPLIGKHRLVAALIAALPVLLLTLQSIGQLTMWDVLMVGGLFAVAYFYIIKSSISPSGR